MCGILATVNIPFDESALDSIRHRGPDGWGIGQVAVGKHLVTLGHRRLSIVDLSPAGHQPMWTRDRRFAIVYNGEIYNHQDLRRTLDDVEFRGHCDTETILYYLAKHGAAAAAEFNGIFAYCLIDTAERKMFIARDPFGVKPVYYRAEGRTVVVSSEIRAIRQFFEDPLDEDSLAELLRLRYLPSPDTLFQNVRKLRPGHVAEIDLNGAAPRLTESPLPWRTCSSSVSRDRRDAIDRYETLLRASIRRQLLADVEVGVLLSGGVDSALVAQLAAREVPYKVKAFTVGFSEKDSVDEISDAAETARVAGLEHHSVRIGFDDFTRALAEINSIVEEPLATTSIVPMFALSRLASSRVKVVLSGQGADETMGGYRRYQMELLQGFVPKFAVAPLRTLSRAIPSDALRRAMGAAGEADDVRRFEAVYSVFGRDQIERLIGRPERRAEERIRYGFHLLHCEDRAESVERMMSLDARLNLADDLLLYTDKITMHHSLECRVPLLDLELVRFIESLPRSWRVGIGSGKRIHKWAAQRMLPASIVQRKKKGFLSPTKRWFQSGGAVREILLAKNSRFASTFDLREVETVLREHEAGANRERHIFLLLSLNYWMRDFLAPRAPVAGCAVAV